MTEWRFVLSSGPGAEVGGTPPSWVAIYSVDEGTRRVVGDGMVIVHDPKGLRVRLTDVHLIGGDQDGG